MVSSPSVYPDREESKNLRVLRAFAVQLLIMACHQIVTSLSTSCNLLSAVIRGARW